MENPYIKHTQTLEDTLTTTRQYIRDLGDFTETIMQQVAQGGLPANIPFENTSYQESGNRNQVQTLEENETDTIRTIADTTVKTRRDNFKKLWEDLQTKTAQEGPRPQAIYFNAHTAKLVVSKGQKAEEESDSIDDDVQMQAKQEKKQKRQTQQTRNKATRQ